MTHLQPMVPERALHLAVVAFLRVALPASTGAIWFHCPNGGGRSKREGASLKAMGVLPGVPDLCVLWRRELSDGAFAPAICWIELKGARGRVSSEQSAFLRAVAKHGHWSGVCRSVDDVERMLRGAGVPLRGTVGPQAREHHGELWGARASS